MSNDIPDDNEKCFFTLFFSELMAENFSFLHSNELTAENFSSFHSNELMVENFSSFYSNELMVENFSSFLSNELMVKNFSTKKQMDLYMSKIASYTDTETNFFLRTNANQESEFKLLIEPKINLSISKQNKYFRVLKSLPEHQIIAGIIITVVGGIILLIIQKIFP